MRKHYMTLCTRETEVTTIKRETGIEVCFEQAVYKGFNELVLNLDGEIIKRNGFNDSEVSYFQRFLNMNKEGIIDEFEVCVNA